MLPAAAERLGCCPGYPPPDRGLDTGEPEHWLKVSPVPAARPAHRRASPAVAKACRHFPVFPVLGFGNATHRWFHVVFVVVFSVVSERSVPPLSRSPPSNVSP
ncbi:hypothetical protein D9623_18085 [Azospirillum brasilense]|uniref:Uncharacterized protein n=1 Tax=Azospirillum brasilense TaxID=192 RepID=A0A4D8QLU6_AZOBR|nr:hypothetical protein D3868_15920 [Azospirillum brasilense]QEL92024.1 hypothetical protein D9621_17845 [Azospirillum brasilense]QEL98326.1 hypothetical protein D9623_18085 [Azospirillum brasilense]